MIKFNDSKHIVHPTAHMDSYSELHTVNLTNPQHCSVNNIRAFLYAFQINTGFLYNWWGKSLVALCRFTLTDCFHQILLFKKTNHKTLSTVHSTVRAVYVNYKLKLLVDWLFFGLFNIFKVILLKQQQWRIKLTGHLCQIQVWACKI